MQFDSALKYLRTCGHFPLQVQIGGFEQRDYPFTSRNSRPYERSFSIQGDKAVLVGWPMRGMPTTRGETALERLILESRLYPMTLDCVRRALQGFGILHADHKELTDVDNDLTFSIGSVNEHSVAIGDTRSLEQHVRQQLSEQEPIIVESRLQDVCVAAYDDTDNTLPRAYTGLWPVTDPQLNAKFISGQYA